METKIMLASSSEMGVDERLWWSELPIDLWYEIFSRLSNNRLLELRRVSKALCSFITELFIPKIASSALISGFIFHWYTVHVPPELMFWFRDLQDHVRYSPIPPSSPEDFVTEYFHDYVAFRRGRNGCFDSEFISSYVSLLPFKMDDVADSIDAFLGCFNGFILVANINRSSSFLHESYYLCNPATKQCITIPVNPKHMKKLESEKDDIHPFVGLAFDPLDPPPHHFKIVRYSTTHFEELDIFCSDTGKWVTHAIHLDDEIRRFELVRRSVYLDGIFYMLSMSNYLLCLNLRDIYAKLKAIKLPQMSSRDDYFGLFEASDRCLYYATEDQLELLLWTFQVKNETSPWLFKYRFNIKELRKLTNGSTLIFKHYNVYAMDLTEEVIIFGYDDYAWSYDVKSNRLCFLCNLDSGSIFRAENRFYPYSCCLVKLEDKMFMKPQLPSVL